MRSSRSLVGSAGLVAWTLACGAPDEGSADRGGAGDNDALVAAERGFQDEYAAAPLRVRGRVLARDGAPVAGAPLELGAAETETDAEGRFEFQAVARRNAVLVVRADGFRVERIPLQLMRALHETELSV